MLSVKYNSKGWTLVELLITMAIALGLLAAAAPDFSEWVQNSKIRTAAESIQNGLTVARTEAVHRNATAKFVSCGGATGNPSWDVIAAASGVQTNVCNGATVADGWERVQFRSAQGGVNTPLSNTPQTTIAFNGLGRQVSTTDPISGDATPVPPVVVGVDVNNSANGTSCYCPAGTCNYPPEVTYAATGRLRCLRVSVSPGGQVRMCDPALNSGPQKC